MSDIAMNIGVEVSESLFSVLYGVYPGVELLGHTVILCLTFEEWPTIFHSIWTILHE